MGTLPGEATLTFSFLLSLSLSLSLLSMRVGGSQEKNHLHKFFPFCTEVILPSSEAKTQKKKLVKLTNT